MFAMYTLGETLENLKFTLLDFPYMYASSTVYIYVVCL